MLGYYSYYHLGKFPEALVPSLASIGAYLLISAVYYYIENFKEKECFIEVVSSKIKVFKDFDSVRFCSSMTNFDPTYTYSVEAVKEGKVVKRNEVKRSIGQFFDTEGFLHKDKVRELFNESNKELTGKSK